MKTHEEAAAYAIKKLAESEQLLDAILGPDITRGHEELQAFAFYRIHGRIALSAIQERFLTRMTVLED